MTPPSRLARAACRYHVVSDPETGRTSGSVFMIGGAVDATLFQGGVDGSDRGEELWTGRASGDGGRVPDDGTGGQSGEEDGSDVRDDGGGARRATSVANW